MESVTPDASRNPQGEGLAEPLRRRVQTLQAGLDPQHGRVLEAHARAQRADGKPLAELLGVSPEAAREQVQRAHEALAAAIRGAGLTGVDFLEGTEAETLRLALPLFDRVLAETAPSPAPATPPGATSVQRRLLVWVGVAVAVTLLVLAGVVLTTVHPSPSALEPELLTAPVMTPNTGEPGRPLPDWPVKLELTAVVEAGQLALDAPRLSTDAFVAVALIDAKGQKWLVLPGDARDPGCSPDCGPLKLHVALDKLAPGSFRVMVMVSEEAFTRVGIWQWLPQADQVAPRWLFARAYAVRRLDH